MHYSSKYENAPMPHSVFFRGGYAIHGTPYIKRLGRRASHGCVRLHPANAARLYKLVLIYGFDNTRITIHR
jgi:lipoprotein-anchoring transpeptidase ErfK/SrfK